MDKMTQLDILNLALEGANQEIRSYANLIALCVTEDTLKKLRTSIRERDEIAELIENEKHPSAATPECISIPISIGGELIDTVNVPKR